MSNYPEHLNPFAEEPKRGGLKISNSFRDFTKTLRKSFRIKKKEPYHSQINYDDVEIRRKAETLRRITMSYPNGREQLTPALPRSRFKERLTKTYYHLPNQEHPGPNPFEEEERHDDIRASVMRRRGKKRAPLPPKSINEQNLNALPHSSNWSLTSADTEISYSTDNLSELGYITDEVERLPITERFVDFNKEMEKLKEDDDSNNNSIKPSKEPNNNVPDLVISCPNSDTESTKSHQEKHEREEDEKEKHGEIEKPEAEVTEEKTQEEDTNSSRNSLDLIIKDITHNLQSAEDTNKNSVDVEIKVTTHNPESEESYLYHAHKSLYLPGSTDELNNLNNSSTQTQSASLYITGSKESLDNDSCNNNNEEECDKSEADQAEEDLHDTPVPKQRKNKLTRSSLLGTTEVQ